MPFSRRSVVRTSGLAATTALAGCLWDNPETAPGHVYVENSTGDPRRVALVIAERTEDPEVRAWYGVPADHALAFEDVLEPDRTHVLRASLPGSPPADRVSATIDPCPEGQEGERVVSVDVQSDGLGVVLRDCQESYTQRELEYVAASDYRLESLDGGLTPTPGAAVDS